jgi:hypothetical protein
VRTSGTNNNWMKLIKARAGDGLPRALQLIQVSGRPEAGELPKMTPGTVRCRLWPGRVAGLSCVALLLSGCAGHRGFRTVAEAQESCDHPASCAELTLKPGVELSTADDCWVRILTKRCNSEDRCIASCLLQGEARNIGGGC